MQDEIHKMPFSIDYSHHHLYPVDKRECTSDFGTSLNSSPSIDRVRSRTAKRLTLFTKSVKLDCCTRIIRQPLGLDESIGFKLQTVSL